jgi:hypothetical protein
MHSTLDTRIVACVGCGFIRATRRNGKLNPDSRFESYSRVRPTLRAIEPGLAIRSVPHIPSRNA